MKADPKLTDLTQRWLAGKEARSLIEDPIGALTEAEWLQRMERRVRAAFEAGVKEGRRQR
jgi:hypothetical protein